MLDLVGWRDIVELWPKFVSGYIEGALEMVVGEDMKRNPLGLRPGGVPVIHQIELLRSELYILSTQNQDESTIEGNIAVLENSNEEMEIQEERLINHVVPVAGDQITTDRQRSAQVLRVRDIPKKRLRYVSQWNGELHVTMSLQQLVMITNTGHKDGREPASLARFIILLGRDKLGGEWPEFHACHK